MPTSGRSHQRCLLLGRNRRPTCAAPEFKQLITFDFHDGMRPGSAWFPPVKHVSCIARC